MQTIGDQLQRELFQLNFGLFKELQDAGQLPLLKQMHLFVGSERTLYNCHYDLQPNLHVPAAAGLEPTQLIRN